MSTGGAVSRRMLGDMCQRRHTASHPHSKTSRVLGPGEAGRGTFVPEALRVASAARRLTSWPGS
jgi:hypothetical protein